MKKKVYFYCVHHMDLIWQFGWDRSHVDNGRIIRSYSDLEERQLLRWMDLMDENESVRHSVEQTLSLRMLIERNPDLKDVIRERLKDGRLCVDGGGDSIVDTNLVSGESIVRNHLYSIKWLEREFEYRPSVAIATDTFGLCAQLPQILRGLGYDALVLHARVFDPDELAWKGLDGSQVYIGKLFCESSSTPQISRWHAFCDGVACVCNQHGCDGCAGSGTVNNGAQAEDPDKFQSFAEEVRSCDSAHAVVYLCSEWQMPSPHFLKAVADLEKACDCEVTFATIPLLRDQLPTPGYDRFRNNKSAPTDISPKSEGNPVCTGCYLSRIPLKQQNRELENRLAAAETWAALAAEFGMTYPRGKLAYLWKRMALTQFHDAVTGPHTDECYQDLLSVGIEIRGGACRIAEQAVSVLAGEIGVEEKPGMQAFAVFNPVNREAGNFPVSVWVDWPFGCDQKTIELTDQFGTPLTVLECEVHPEMGRAQITFTGAILPPVGYSVFYYRPVPDLPAAVPGSAEGDLLDVLENKRYRIQLNADGLGEIVDKELDSVICTDGTASLELEEDYGSCWETLAKPYFNRNLTMDCDGKPVHEHGPGYRSVTVSGRLEDPILSRDRHVHRVVWQQRITLYDQVPGIHLRTELTWDTENMRISMQVPLAFRTPDNAAVYEVPFGVVWRKSYAPVYGIHTKPNGDWPCLNSITCENTDEGYTVTLCNRGLPCHRVEDGRILLGLVRSPQIPVYNRNVRGAKDMGPHFFETVLFSEPGGLRESRAVQRGIEFNARFLAASCSSSGGSLAPTHSFLPQTAENIALSALKRAEDNDDIVIRAWETCGEAAPQGVDWPNTKAVAAVNLLERPAEQTGEPVSSFKPFEVRTFRGRSDQLLNMTP